MSITTDIRQAAKNEQQRTKEALSNSPMGLFMTVMTQEEPMSDEQKAKMKAFDENPVGYAGREKIPEVLLPFADLYHELTGQECTKRVFTDWLDTFYMWKDERLSPDDIRTAWAQSKSDNGFFVGRPGALTVTAVGAKSKAKPAVAKINTDAVERTQKFLEEKEAVVGEKTPIPEDLRIHMQEWKARVKRSNHGRTY